jgi:hypothetical protein
VTAPTTIAPPTLEQAAALAAQQTYAAAQDALRQQLAAALAAIWAGMMTVPNFDPPAAARFVQQILPISLGAQRVMTQLVVAQYNAQARPPTPIVIAPATTTGETLRKHAPADYYQRPFREIKWRLSQGRTVGEAVEAGRRRAESIALTDLQLARTHTARAYAQELNRRPPAERGARGKVVGYRRVLSSNPNHCALCVLASTQGYNVKGLVPIHPNCGCTVAFIHEDDDRALEHVLDPQLAQEVHNIVRRDLGESYVDAGGRLGDAHYRDIIITHEHGELGPVLGVRGQRFTGPSEIARLSHQRVNPLPPDEIQNLDEA